MKLLQILIFLIVLPIGSAFGQVQISSLRTGKFLGKSLEILRSPVKLNINEVIRNRNFKLSSQEVPRYGYTYDDIWAKLEIENSSAEPEDVFFELRGPIELVEAYLVKNNEVNQISKAGMFMFPEDESLVSGHSYPVVKFRVPLGLSTVYFSESAVAPHFPIISYDRDGFEKRVRENSSVLNILLGICAAYFLILFIIFIFVNSQSVIYLIASFLSFFVLIGFITGMLRTLYHSFGGSKASFLSGYIKLYPLWPLSCSMFLIFLSLFSISHLGKENFLRTRSSKIMTIIALASQALLEIVSQFDTIVAMNVFSTGFNITIGQAVYWSFSKYKLGKKEELFTLIGWVIYGVFNSLQLFYFLGIADNTFFAIWGSIFGFFTILSLLTISLVERNRRDLHRTIGDKKLALIKLEENFNELRKRDEIIQIFSSPKINLEISLGLNPLEFKPRYLDTAVVFFDMRGFTKLSESLDLKKVHDIINQYVGEIIKGVQDDGGFIDKIIGDAIMAQFEKPDRCLDSVKKIRTNLSALNRDRVLNSLPPVKFGTGISYGKVLVANFGSTVKMDRTIIGDIVNKASRIESLTKSYCVDVLFDQSFYDIIGSHSDIRFLGTSKLKGRENNVNLYEYFGHNTKDVRDLKFVHAEKINQAMRLASDRSKISDAIVIIDRLIENCPKHTYKMGELMDQTLVTLKNVLLESDSEAKDLNIVKE